jgi:hypothetical protein
MYERDAENEMADPVYTGVPERGIGPFSAGREPMAIVLT